MQVQESILIAKSDFTQVELFYEGENIYTIIQTVNHGRHNQEEVHLTLTREELFDISQKVFPNLN